MLMSLGIIILLALVVSFIFSRLKMPNIIGMLFVGILIGPFCLNLIDEKILSISSELRQVALIIILVKAGLSLNLSDLKKVGLSAVLMSFLPASFEIVAYVLLGPIILNISRLDAALMGAVLAAVSPAVVVPRMVGLIETGYGVEKSIPQMILAGASCDDIFVIVLFSSFLDMAKGGNLSAKNFFNIPISIVLGVIVGAFVGIILSFIFDKAFKNGCYIRNTIKAIIILALSFILIAAEKALGSIVPFSGLLAVVSMAATIKLSTIEFVTKRLSEKFGKLWLAAEIFLFVLVGAAVDISYALKAGPTAILLILFSLVVRSFGVLLAISFSNLNNKEKLFTVFSYLPKATVQAAIGSVPLSYGLKSGNIILSVAVLGILVTAPVGAFLIDRSYKILLEKENRAG